MSKPYLQGLKDFKTGKGWKNPYKFNSRAWRDWEQAYIDCANKRFDEITKKHNFR